MSDIVADLTVQSKNDSNPSRVRSLCRRALNEIDHLRRREYELGIKLARVRATVSEWRADPPTLAVEDLLAALIHDLGVPVNQPERTP